MSATSPFTSLKRIAQAVNPIGVNSYLSTTSGVLSSTSGNQFRIAVLDEVLIEAHVLLFGQNRVIGLHAILLKHCRISIVY